jgi:hypothetical protein
LETKDPNRDWKFLKALDHETVNLLTHMHFIHLSWEIGSFRRFEEFQDAVCQVERKGLFNKLQALASGNKYALHDIYGPGFQIYLAGSVAYVAQGIPVEARLYDPMNCTQQIPAEIGSKMHGNVTQKYANAQTMILQDFPTKVPCTREYPPKWKIEDKWYCSFPTAPECNKAPTQLNLTYDHSFCSMRAMFDGINGGILTATQLQGSRLWRQLAQCQEAIAHALAYTALYNSPNQVTLVEPLDQTTMKKVAYVSAMMTTPFFALFGWTWFYLSALMGLFTITNYNLQNDPEDDRIVELERERIWVVAARQPLGRQVQSPPPPYDSGEEHHGLQQGASRESSPDAGWDGAWYDQPSGPAIARRNRSNLD